MSQHGPETATELLALDHLALRVPDPDGLARFLCEHLGMESAAGDEGVHVAGAPGGRSRLFLFESDQAPEAGVLERMVLRVSDLERAIALLPANTSVREEEPELVVFPGPHGLELGLTSVFGGGTDYDLDHVVLRVMDPDETTIALAELGFVPRSGAVHVADKQIRLRAGVRSSGANELLDHLGVLVQSVEAVRHQALRAGIGVDEMTLAPNRLGLYVSGPERIRIEYAEPG